MRVFNNSSFFCFSSEAFLNVNSILVYCKSQAKAMIEHKLLFLFCSTWSCILQVKVIFPCNFFLALHLHLKSTTHAKQAVIQKYCLSLYVLTVSIESWTNGQEILINISTSHHKPLQKHYPMEWRLPLNRSCYIKAFSIVTIALFLYTE